jgi:hypothetical protein
MHTNDTCHVMMPQCDISFQASTECWLLIAALGDGHQPSKTNARASTTHYDSKASCRTRQSVACSMQHDKSLVSEQGARDLLI